MWKISFLVSSSLVAKKQWASKRVHILGLTCVQHTCKAVNLLEEECSLEVHTSVYVSIYEEVNSLICALVFNKTTA